MVISNREALKSLPIGHGCQLISGYAFKSSDFGNLGIPVIKIKNIQNAVVTTNESDCVTEKLITEKMSKFKVSDRDILIAMTGQGSVGRVGRARLNVDFAVLNQRVGKFLPDEESLNSSYLYHVLRTPYYQAILFAAGSGSGQPNLSPSQILNVEIPYPPYETQALIGKILDNFDEKILINDRINQTLEEMAQAIFKSWFVDFDQVKAKAQVIAQGGSEQDANLAAMQIISGKTRDQLAALEHTHPEQYTQLHTTASLFPSAFVDSELGEIPEGWEVSTIGNEFDITMGQSPPGETYNENKEGMIFYQGRRDFGDRFPQPRVYCTAPKRTAKKGDVLLSVRAPVGDLNIAETDCCIGRGLAAIRHKSGDTSISYYTFMFLKKQFESFNTEGTVFGAVNKDSLSSIKIIKPSKLITSAFTSATNPLDELIFSNHFEINALKEARDILLPKLLSGEIDVSQLNLDDESCQKAEKVSQHNK